MKLSKEELKEKVSNLEIDDDLKIGLLEDIEDSFEDQIEDDSRVSREEYDDMSMKYEDMKKRYIERFLSKEEVAELEDAKEKIEEVLDDSVEVEEEAPEIDIQEI
ncbi:MAG TPA: hypothetical protein DHV77_01380 [Erysipelotrichaceae bacterium]|nr:hypothetical protein [Erysipelotrichaceae bacterium]